MNYNMMVLGFPTVLRVVNEWPNENFRGNRTVDDMVKWAVWVGAMAPLDVDGIDSYESDLQRFEVSGEEVEVLDLDDERHTGINWTLWGANFVSICNVLWIIVRATRGGLGRFGKRGTAGADGGEEEEE